MPASDLWERLEADLAELEVPADPPANGFTIRQFQERLKLTDNGARMKVTKLVNAGKVRKYGRLGRLVYFVYVDDGQPESRPKPSR